MVIVDSSVWIDALNGKLTPETHWLSLALDQEPIGLTTLILCEVLQGIRLDHQFRETEQHFRKFTVFASPAADLAISAAQNFRKLRSRGITVRKTVDCIIATFCIEQGLQLLHRDRDFDAFEAHLGLLVVHPPALALN